MLEMEEPISTTRLVENKMKMGSARTTKDTTPKLLQ
jgi:hypothetical protein